MNNNDCRIATNHVFRLTFLLILFVTATKGALYRYGPEYGDKQISWPKWEIGSEEITLETPVPIFGEGKFATVWVNTVGSLTHKQLMDPRIENLVNNIALSPLSIQSQEGASSAVFYRQTKIDLPLFSDISEDIASSILLPPSDSDLHIPDFKPSWALVVTWDKISSVSDEDLVNTFQVILTTDGVRSFAIFNYDATLSWNSAMDRYAAAGIFIAPDAQSTCSYALPSSQTEEVSDLATTLGNNGILGRFVFIISDPIKCTSKFESACDVLLPASDWGYSQPFFSITGDSWNVYARHTCNEGFSLQPRIVSERIDCVYEPDYYTSMWAADPGKCLDFNATRKFELVTKITAVGDKVVIGMDELMDPQSDEYKEFTNLVEETIKKMLNLTDIAIVVTYVTEEGTAPELRSETQVALEVGVEVYVPTYIHKKLTAEEIETMITMVLLENDSPDGITFIPQVTVTEQTDKCLQGCLCRNKKDPKLCRRSGKIVYIQPDSCCGGCNGKPYSSTIKACCNNEHLYDPTKARCCNGRVKKGVGEKCPGN